MSRLVHRGRGSDLSLFLNKHQLAFFQREAPDWLRLFDVYLLEPILIEGSKLGGIWSISERSKGSS